MRRRQHCQDDDDVVLPPGLTDGMWEAGYCLHAGVFAWEVKVLARAEETDPWLREQAEHTYVERAGGEMLGNGVGERALKIDR